MTVVDLAEADDVHHYGGKATELGAAIRAELPVPDGVVVSWETLDELVDDGDPWPRILERIRDVEGPYVVRSSGVAEDGEAASFAGQHSTVVNIPDAVGVLEALETVHASARSEAVLEYRDQLGIEGQPKMGAIVQTMVDADAAGVLFTRNPVDGTDERVVEAAWGLGEAVVDGLVTPDRYRLRPDGVVLERRPGPKEVRVEPAPDGGTRTLNVPEADRTRLCLDDAQLRALARLADRFADQGGGGHDIEWAFEDDDLYLLQRRDITTGIR